MTTFKIVFTFDVFFSAETTMHCKVTCILYKKQAHFSQLFCLQVRSVTPNRQTSGESASLPQYLGCNTVFDMRLRVTFLPRKTVSFQSNIAHRE